MTTKKKNSLIPNLKRVPLHVGYFADIKLYKEICINSAIHIIP